jgi:hypothetical protein
MFGALVSRIKSKRKAEWNEYFRGWIEWLRDYVQSNGEKAAVLGFIFGIFAVTFYKLVILIACLALVAYQLVLLIAEP